MMSLEKLVKPVKCKEGTNLHQAFELIDEHSIEVGAVEEDEQ